MKIEDGAGGGHAEEGLQEEADAGGERQHRSVNEAGEAVSAEAGLMLRENAELQAQAIEGMERTQMLGEELQRTKVRIAELAAEVKMRDEALLQTIAKSKDDLLLCKDALPQAKDAEIRCLRVDDARLSAHAAAAAAAARASCSSGCVRGVCFPRGAAAAVRGAALQRGSRALGACGAAAARAVARAPVGYADRRQTRRGKGRQTRA